MSLVPFPRCGNICVSICFFPSAYWLYKLQLSLLGCPVPAERQGDRMVAGWLWYFSFIIILSQLSNTHNDIRHAQNGTSDLPQPVTILPSLPPQCEALRLMRRPQLLVNDWNCCAHSSTSIRPHCSMETSTVEWPIILRDGVASLQPGVDGGRCPVVVGR